MSKNFGNIKDIAIESLVKGTSEKNELVKIFESFIKAVNSSSILKTEFTVYNNLQNKKIEDKHSAEIYINENAKLFNSYTRKEILKENEMLVSNMIDSINSLISNYELKKESSVGEVIGVYEEVIKDLEELKQKLETNTLGEDINDDSNGSNMINNMDNILTEIHNLILESTKSDFLPNIDKKHKALNSLINEVSQKSVGSENKMINNEVPFNIVLKKATEIFNEKYSFLNETEKAILKAHLSNNEKEKEELFNTLINENLNFIKRRLVENFEGMEKEVAEKLQLTENKLKTMNYSNSTEISHYSKLLKLREELNKF